MVLNRCATITLVVSFPISFKLFIISNSVCESKEEVGSSHNRMGARFKMARARDTRCFSPPESLSPRSPTTVSYPLGNFSMMSCK
mmetsp:Transcript_21483/g.44860  ORF Transcript_21483/g.44860 Transcript_21483/m.44860 type:complete len:85 (+) Transcript_21483:201-455(+)